MYSLHFLVLLAVCFVYTLAVEPTKKQKPVDVKRSLSGDCENSYSTTCFKLDIVSWIDKLDEANKFSVLPGVSLVKDNGSARANTADIVAEVAREFPNDPDARVDAFLLRKVTGFLNSHSINMKLVGKQSPVETGRKKHDDHKKGGGGHGMEYLLAGAAMMKGTMLTMAMGTVAAIAGKALLAGLISLMLSTIMGLKSLTQQTRKERTYEIYAKPSQDQGWEDRNAHAYSSAYGRSYEPTLPSNKQTTNNRV